MVSTETQNDESAIQIQPANPQVIYPPVYNPTYVWGPQVAGDYPAFSNPQGYYGPQGGYGPQGYYGPQGGYGPQGYYGAQGGYGPRGGYGSPGDSGSGFGSGVNIGGLFSGLLSAAGTIGSGLLGSGMGFGVWGLGAELVYA